MSGSANSAALTFLSASIFSIFGLFATYLPPQLTPFRIAAKRAVTVGLVGVGSLLGVVVLADSYFDGAAKFTAVLGMVVGIFTLCREYRFEISSWRFAKSVAKTRQFLQSMDGSSEGEEE